jgi:multidrug efflux pump subunit AcrA (membrane-fusion protein)
LQVGLGRNDRAELVPVKIGRDYGNSVEIVSRLQPTDAVIVDPSDSLVAGMPVRLSNKPTGGSGR